MLPNQIVMIWPLAETPVDQAETKPNLLLLITVGQLLKDHYKMRWFSSIMTEMECLELMSPPYVQIWTDLSS